MNAETLSSSPPCWTASRRARVLGSWACQLVAAVILAQTLFFKFTGAEESRWIFQTLGVEPWGRLLTGSMELLCVVLLLVQRLAALGALVTLGVMAGAVVSHLFVLGIEVQGDGGLLFSLALVTLACAAVVAALRRAELAAWSRRLGRL